MCKCPAEKELCSDLQRLADTFDELNTWLVEHLKDLDLLIEEHQLLAAGANAKWEIWFAVDYCDVQGFLLPFSELLRDYQRLKDDLAFRRETTRAYLARMCAFVRLGQQGRAPLLIPPYLREFSHRFLTYTETEFAKRDTSDYLITLWNEIEAAIEELDGVSSGLGYESVDKLSDDELMTFLLEKYPNLVLVAQAEAFDVYERMEILSRTGIRAVPMGHRLGTERYDSERVQFWKEGLRESNPYRRGKARAGETLTDAQALTSIESANRSAQEGSAREAYYLISGSEDVVRTAERARSKGGCEIVLPSGRRTSIVRPLATLLLYLHHVGPRDHMDGEMTPPSVLASLEASRRDCATLEHTFSETSELLRLCPKRNRQLGTIGPAPRCELAKRRGEVERGIEEASRLRHELEDAQVVLSDNPDLVTFSQKVIAAEDPSALEEALTGLVRRMLRDAQLRKSVEAHVVDLREQMIMSVAGLNAQVDAYTRELQPSTVAYLLEAPFHIRFQSETLRAELSEFFGKVEAIAASGDIRSVERAFSDLTTYVLSGNLAPYEKELVELVILLGFSRNSLAARLADACLNFDVGHLRCEFTYLSIRGLLRYDWKSARSRCRSALDGYPEDPRFHFLLGFFAWREYAETKAEVALDEALSHTRRSIALTDREDPLLLDEVDNLAYFASEAGNLAEAHEAAVRLEADGVSPAHYNRLETIGKVYCALASSGQFGRSLRLEHVSRGITALERCLTGFVTDELRGRVVVRLEKARILRQQIAQS